VTANASGRGVAASENIFEEPQPRVVPFSDRPVLLSELLSAARTEDARKMALGIGAPDLLDDRGFRFP
jgi:hypothetical protein